jgi:3-hydroxybutyryl-CoA dehydrogenase
MSKPGQVGIIGGGTMGAGIAYAYLLAGSTVHLIEVDPDRAAAAHERVRSMIRRAKERGRIDVEMDEIWPRFTTGTAVADAATADLVIEAVPEDLGMKVAVLAEAERVVGAGTILASNTSSIAIGEIGAALDHPDRFVGLHFFNPVPASAMVEVIHSSATSAAATETAAEWVRSIDKRPLVVRDSPGFASSRLGVLLGLEAVRMLETGVASAEDIDAAMTLGYKHPIGPLALTDLVGVDVRLNIADYLSDKLGSRFEPPALMRQMVAEGKLGRKSGQGFFSYAD